MAVPCGMGVLAAVMADRPSASRSLCFPSHDVVVAMPSLRVMPDQPLGSQAYQVLPHDAPADAELLLQLAAGHAAEARECDDDLRLDEVELRGWLAHVHGLAFHPAATSRPSASLLDA